MYILMIVSHFIFNISVISEGGVVYVNIRILMICLKRERHIWHGREGWQDRQPRGTWWCVCEPTTNTLLLVRVGSIRGIYNPFYGYCLKFR